MTERPLRPSVYPMTTLALTLAAFAMVLASSGCSRMSEPKSAAAHPETLDAAKALAASRSVPILIDFYSPT